MLDDRIEHRLGGRDGNGETDADRAAGLRIDRRIDPQQVAAAVDQRPARVAEVDRGIGLDEIFEVVDVQVVAPQRGDDAERDGLADAERVADRQHHVSDARLLHVAEHDHRQAPGLDPDHGEVGFGIGADDIGRRLAAIGQADLDLVGALDHVVVGQDVAVGADDHARAQAGHLFLRRQLVAEEALEKRILQQRMGLVQGLAGEDVDHGRHGAAGGVAVAAGHAQAGWCLQHRHRASRSEPDLGRHAPHPLRPQRRDHHINAEGDRDGLREQEPVAAHGEASVSAGRRGFRGAGRCLPPAARRRRLLRHAGGAGGSSGAPSGR